MMKKLLSILAFVVLTFSCQQNEEATSKDINSNSRLVTLLSRVAHSGVTNRDGGSEICFQISLPVTFTINGQTQTVTSQEEYISVQNAISQFEEEENTVIFNYPMYIVNADGSLQTIESEGQLNAALDLCENSHEEEEDIECMNINYPIQLSYNNGASGVSTILLNNDVELYNFLESLENNDSFQINYPLTLTDALNTSIVVNTNDELENVLEAANSECGVDDEDSDDDDNDNDNDDDDDDDDDNEDENGGKIIR